jgi:hypothetical protein
VFRLDREPESMSGIAGEQVVKLFTVFWFAGRLFSELDFVGLGASQGPLRELIWGSALIQSKRCARSSAG